MAPTPSTKVFISPFNDTKKQGKFAEQIFSLSGLIPFYVLGEGHFLAVLRNCYFSICIFI